MQKLLITLFGLALPSAAMAFEANFQGYIEPEATLFVEEGTFSDQERYNTSLAGQLEVDLYWADDKVHVALHPFTRADLNDDNRTHWDLREARVELLPHDRVALSIGLGQIFWGVTEVVHLVDIVNQTDGVEGFDGEDKLGQPMAQAVIDMGDYGILDMMVMPFFRERTFADNDGGRPRFPLPIDRDFTTYESADSDRNIDWAARYSIVIDDFDLGLSFFSGNARAPDLVPVVFVNGAPCAPPSTPAYGRPPCPTPPGFPFNVLPGTPPTIEVRLAPHYPTIDQLAFDGTATLGNWLLKLEAAGRHVHDQYDFAATGGVEYSFYQIFNTNGDLGIVAEYAFDDRGEDLAAPFQNDAILGLRWALNNTQSTALLVAGIYDVDNGTSTLSLEGDTRVGENFKLTVEGRFFLETADTDPFAAFEKDSFAQLRFAWFF